MQEEQKNLQGWISLLSHADIPVLGQTARNLAILQTDKKDSSARAISKIIAGDPLMTLKLLRYLQQNKHKSQLFEVVEIEQVLLMIGVEHFLQHVPARPLVEEILQHDIGALTTLLRVVHRSHRASAYAREWAALLHDLHYEEVRIAALLHEVAEILLWCFAPMKMQQILSMQQHDPALRSRAAQEAVLGFNLADLQKALAQKCGLPELLLHLMDEGFSDQQRVRNVIIATNLARHSANGWDNAALPDDYKDAARLLRLSPERVMAMVGAEAAPAAK
jgi:hypothetical protein